MEERKRARLRRTPASRASKPTSVFTATMGGGARYPYPKQVWSPAGGWWTRPSNWKSNTAIAFAGILTFVYAGWTYSAEKEVRYIEPVRPIPSMLWAKQYRDRQKSE
ncbi:hypothetical protein FOMPIDRAFT_1048229 [Fomitopsis schrenkii]|uniref:Uncharacterized protein n=1 Tax=Fomitopsis schrenkii TaxID=2126942 RepID=S8EBD1_FOMSC|nr:hypothetical protein FOMPIDRAFT_1048229 [Fomitopsis schrenkii]